jgi:chaperonin GroEL
MQNFTEEMFGTCKKVIIQKGNTLFVSDSKNQETVDQRIEDIKESLETPGIDDDEKELLTYRLQQLSGGIAILRVGAATESELIERYDRVDDALNATKAALEEGILPGGGVALARASLKINDLLLNEKNDSISAGMRIVRKSCVEPFKQIIRNSGKSPDSLLEKILQSDETVGYDSSEGVYGDMFQLGIVDPKKVVRCALENASSAAIMLLSVGSSLVTVSKN